MKQLENVLLILMLHCTLQCWWGHQIGLLGGTPAKGWKRDLLEKAGADFDLDRVRAAIDDRRHTLDKRMTDRASPMAEKKARLLGGLSN